LVSEIEYELQDYLMQVPSQVIGEKVLKKLVDLDHVAYVRFASVYRQFRTPMLSCTNSRNLKKDGSNPRLIFTPDADGKVSSFVKTPNPRRWHPDGYVRPLDYQDGAGQRDD